MKGGAQKEARISQVAVVEKGWPSRKATLYVYVEADSSLGEAALAEAAHEAGRKWQQSRLSTTGALQEAAAAGIPALVRQGQDPGSGPGISCAILQPEGIFLAQAGTTRAYVLGLQVCRRVAPSSPWDPNHVDVCDEPLPPRGMLLLAPSVLEGALPLLQGGLAPREVQRLIKAWLQDKPQLSALLATFDDGRELALGAGVRAAVGEVEEGRPAAAQQEAKVRPSFVRRTRASGKDEAPALAQEPSFPLLRALRLPLLAVVVLLALLILGGIGWYLPSRQKADDEARLASFLERASRARQEALLISDVTSARGVLGQAEDLVREAGTLRPRDRRVISVKQQLDGDLDRVNSVVRPNTLITLVDLGKHGGEQSAPSRIVADGNNLYVLDRGTGRLYKFLLDQNGQSLLNLPNSVLVRKGDLHGGVPLVDLWDAVWMPPGALRPGNSLLVLGAQGILLDYRPERGLQVPLLRGVQGWGSFRAARGFNGNLYVLDSAAEQVWRYIPTSNGYDSEPRGILEGAQIRDGVDLAVDGNVYVLTASGTVWQFSGEAPKAFRQGKMDRPLASPAALFASPSTKYVYVADRGNGRIVAFDKEGEFRFQVKGEALEGVQGLHVDEGQGRLYFASGQRIFVAAITLPKP